MPKNDNGSDGEGHADHAEDGVVAYGSKLNIRQKCQREFSSAPRSSRTCNLKKGAK